MTEIAVGPPGRVTGLRVPGGHLVVGGAAFVALTLGVFAWLFSRMPAGPGTPLVPDLRWSYLVPLLLVLPVETVASATRIWLICRVLHPGVSFGACVRSELANVAVATLTPSQSGGGPGQIYMLNRAAGVAVGTGLTATLLSFMGTMVGLLILGLYVLLSRVGAGESLVLAPVWTLTVLAGLLVLGATWPDPIRRALAALSRTLWRALRRPETVADWWPPGASHLDAAVDRMDSGTAWLVDLLYVYRANVRHFLRHGKACIAGVCLLSVTFLLARALMPYLCARFLGVEAGTLRQILEAQMALIFLVFFAPTPGGAGLAEGASLWMMADIVPPGVAPYYNLLWRGATVYLSALAGLLCLGRTLARDARGLVGAAGRPGTNVGGDRP
jgi:hypothetical protein